MNAIDFTTNIPSATSLYVAKDLYAKKRAKLGANKKIALDEVYNEFLATIRVPEVKVDPMEEYNNILKTHDMVAYIHDIKRGNATGAKKLRVGEIVSTASVKFSDAISVPRPVEVRKEEPIVVEREIEKPVVNEEMTRTRRHEETPVYQEAVTAYQEPSVSQVANVVNSRRLDSYLSNSLDHNTTVDDQKFDKLAKKLSEIDALTRKTTDLQSQEETLLAQEKAMDTQINEALRKADDDYFSKTQELDLVAQRIQETKARMAQKKELLDRLVHNKVA